MNKVSITKFLIRISIGSLLLLTGIHSLSAQTEIRGQIRSQEDGLGLPGATVIIKGTSVGTVTDIDGNFVLSGVAEGNVLVASFVGYRNREVVVGLDDFITLDLELDIQTLNEVVVIGYGTVQKRDLTGAVASVKGADLTKVPSVSPEQALQGKVAGVRVTSNSGAPGDAPTVRIRGVGTFGNPDPIFVVDGVILDDVTFLSPADIESMEILKDASSTAMYGSRGANGVIIITTKSGSDEGKTTVNFSSEYSLQTIQSYIDVLDAREFATVLNQIQPGTFNNLTLLEDTDWQREIYRSAAPIYNAQLSVSGGGEKSRYYVGAGYFKQEGIIPKSEFEKITLKINNQYDLVRNVSLGHNLTFTSFDRQNTSNVVASGLRAWPTDSPFEDTGEFRGVRGNGNPLAAIEYTNSWRDGLRAVGNLYAQVKFLDNFTFKTSYGVDLEYADNLSFTPVFFVTPQQQNDETAITKGRFSKENWILENTLNFNWSISNHTIDAVAGYTLQEDNTEILSNAGANLLRDDILYLSNDLTDIRVTNDASIKSLMSYLFRVNYTFLGKYLFTATFRRDGSSIFSEENRWGNFPSLGVGWRISDEPFFNEDGLVSDIKLRGSWGIVGNDKVAANERFTSIISEQGAVFGEVLNPGSTFGKSGNPLIRWEEANQTDLGAEVAFLNDALRLEVDYYRKVTRDILIDLPLPGHFGNGSFTFVKFNAADVRNEGVELSINYSGGFQGVNFTVNANGATVTNEVIKMGEDTGADNFLPLGNLGNGQNVKRVAVGEPIGYFYGYKVAGIFQNESELDQFPRLSAQGVGDFRYEDINGDGEITTDDRTFIGSPIPDFTYGFGLQLSYENFELSLDFQGEAGREIYNGKNAVRAGQYNYETTVLNAWNGEGTSSSEPRISAGGINYSQSDWFIQNGSFFRLRNVTIGYSLPKQWLEAVKVGTAKAYLRGTNVFTLTDYTGYTPEIGGNISQNGIDTGVYPVTSIYSVGLSATF